MRKLIAVILVLVITFPITALDVISMNNGKLYIGEILQMDINDKIELMTQDGELVTLKYRDVKEIKKVNSEGSSPTIIVNNNNENSNQNTNINGDGNLIGSSDTVADKMIYTPGKKGGLFGIGYIAPTCLYRGISYNVDTYGYRSLKSDIVDFLDAIEMNHFDLPEELEQMIDDLRNELDKNKQKNKTANGMIWGSLGLEVIAMLIGGMDYSVDDFKDGNTLPGILAVTGFAIELGTLIPSLSMTNPQDQVKNIIAKYNYIY